MSNFMRTSSSLALVAAASMLASTAMAADLGGNCCTDLEERVAELEATTVRKGNRKVSVQLYGQISESVIWWNDGSESNVYVQENNAIQNRLGFQGSAKITSDWSAGFKLEYQVRAYRSSAANQLALGASNNTNIPAYNITSASIREANWYLQSNHYGRITVGRSLEAAVGTSTISLVNPDGFSGPAGAGFAQGSFFLRRAGTTGAGGLSQRTWQTTSWLNNGDGPLPLDYAHTNSGIKYTSPFFLGHTKSSGFQFSANWGMDDAWSVALRYAEEFGPVRVAAGIGYTGVTSGDRGFCAAANNTAPETAPVGPQQGDVDCNALAMSGSLLHTPTGLYVSGGWAQIKDNEARRALAIAAPGQLGVDTTPSFWWIQAGWQAKLNALGSTIFWGQYVDLNTGVNRNNGVISTVGVSAIGDQLARGIGGLGTTAIIRNANTTTWGLGVSQNIDAAAMTLYMGYHNIQTDITLGSTATNARAKSNPIDDFHVFYTGATIRF